MTLPPFPVDEQSLDLLARALNPWAHGDTGAGCSSLEAFLDLVSRIGGADTEAVDNVEQGVTVMRCPQYSSHDLIEALVAEIRNLRAAAQNPDVSDCRFTSA